MAGMLGGDSDGRDRKMGVTKQEVRKDDEPKKPSKEELENARRVYDGMLQIMGSRAIGREVKVIPLGGTKYRVNVFVETKQDAEIVIVRQKRMESSYYVTETRDGLVTYPELVKA